MFKRIIALCLAFILTFSLVGTLPAFAAPSASVADVNLMFDLGIVEKTVKTGLFDTGYTRADFARTLSMLDKGGPLNLVSQDDENIYASDISDNEYFHEIVSVIELGYMKNDDKNCFRPGDSLTLNDAIYALVNILGYNVLVNKASDVASYRIVAQKIGLLKGVNVKDQEKLSDQDVASIVANAMGIRFFTAGNVNLEDKCFFDCWDLTVNTGMVYATSNMGISGETASYKRVNIDGKLYYTEILIPDDMVGCEVTFYVDNSKNKNEIVSIYSTYKEDSMTVDSGDIINVVESGSYVVVHLDNDEKLKVPKNGFAIVNGNTKTPSKAVFDMFKSGKATFLDTDSDGDYDIVNITLMVQKVVGGVSADDKVVTDWLTGETINFSKAKNFEVYLNNKASDLSALKQGYVIGISCDAYTVSGSGVITYNYNTAKTIKIYASSKKMTSSYVDGFEDNKIVIEDMVYSASAGYLDLVANSTIAPIKMNEYVDVYFDMFGDIAYYVLSDAKNRFKYGYLIAATTGNIDAFTRETKFKILCDDGSINIYVTNEKFVLDGGKVTSGQTLYTVGSENVDLTERQVVRYYAENGILKELDTKVIRPGVENVKNSLSEDMPFNPNQTGNSKKRLTNTIVIEKNGIITKESVFFVDGAPIGDPAYVPNDDDFWIGFRDITSTSDDVEDDIGYIACYDINDDMGISCYVSYAQYGKALDATEFDSLAYSVPPRVVEKITATVNEKGDEGYKLYLGATNEYKEFFAPKDIVKIYEPATSQSDPYYAWGAATVKLKRVNTNRVNQVISPGDIIRVNVDKNGNVNYIEKWFDLSSTNGSCVFMDKTSNINYSFANIEKIVGKTLIYSDEGRVNKNVLAKKEKSTSFPVFNVREGKVKMVSFADIPSIADGKENVKAFLRYHTLDCRDIIVYVYD